MKNRFVVSAVFLLFVTLASQPVHAQLLLDDFGAEKASYTLNIAPGGTEGGSNPYSGAVGTDRVISATYNAAAGTNALFSLSDTSFTHTGSGLDYRMTIGIDPTTPPTDDVSWSITYTGFGGGLDLSTYTRLATEWTADHTGFNNPNSLYFTLEDSTGSTHTSTVTWPGPAAITQDQILTTSFPLSAFAVDVDLTDIQRIEWGGDTDHAADYVFGRIYADGVVPEPSSAVLAALAAALLLARHRR